MHQVIQKPVVSVVIPTHNRPKLLERSIRSVLAQTFDDFEVLVVDDGSTDDTQDRVLAVKDTRLRYIRHPVRRGAPAARNSGVENAIGEFIAFQDSDDVWLIDKLEKQVALIQESPATTAVVYSGFLRVKNGSLKYTPKSEDKQIRGKILPDLLSGNFVSTQTMLVRRGAFDEIGAFDPDLRRLQDWDLAIRLADRYEFDLVDEPLAMVYDTLGNISADAEAFVESLTRILEKHHDLFAAHPAHLARHLTFLGHCYCSTGDRCRGRLHLRQALRHHAGFPSTWMVLLASFLGSSTYRAVARQWATGDLAL